MRTLTRVLLITAFFAVVSLVHSFWIIDRQAEVSVPVTTGKFIVLSDKDRNDELQRARSALCGGYKSLLSEIQRRVDQQVNEAASVEDIMAKELATMDAMEEGGVVGLLASQVTEEVVRDSRGVTFDCLVMVYSSGNPYTAHVGIVSPDGDFIFGLTDDKIVTAWADVDQSEWEFDTLLVANRTNGDFDSALSSVIVRQNDSYAVGWMRSFSKDRRG